MKKLTYTTPAKFLKITLAKSYLNPIITGQFVKHITNRLDHQKLIYPVKVVSFSQEF